MDDQRVEHAKKLIASRKTLRLGKIVVGDLFETADAAWVEVRAEGRTLIGRDKVAVTALVRFSDRSLIATTCIAPIAQKGVWDARVRKLALSLVPRA